MVQSIAYNEGNNQYVVTDNYMDILFLNKVKENLTTEISNITNNSAVTLSLYPEKNCTFIGDCADCDEYYDSYEQEINIDNQFKNSTELNMTNYLNQNHKDFVNNSNFKYIFEITGQFAPETTNYSFVIDTILNKLNQLGYKNNYGYIITLNNNVSNNGFQLEKVVYQVKGEESDDKTFKNPIVVDLNKNN